MRNTKRWLVCAFVPVAASLGAAAVPVTATAAPDTGSLIAPIGVDTEVTFESDGLTFFGSLRTPQHPVTGTAALLLPGSGPTDRNGNQPGISADTLIRIANILADHGIPSLRFDKFGSGATGLGGLAPEAVAGYGFADQVDHAVAAAALLRDRTGVGPDGLLVLGHSEGALTALALADRGVTPTGIGLLQPLPMRYLDLLRAQISVQLDGATASGQMPPGEADTVRADLERTVESLRATGTVPSDVHPMLAQLGLNAANAKFLSEADALDPSLLAAGLPESTSVLLTCSDKDLNVSCAQVGPLRDALAHTSVDFHRFGTASHLLKELGPVPPSTLDTLVPLPMSTEFSAALTEWAGGHGR
ncbi:alpha/beta hydrolase [Rhodococcus phenolicus]|uniref:alpha/beta hydrolase n=1 Tax=Rhodococcus phenolicus TaxID=263849 RepID=UPI000A50BC07|nr:alpha/beta hydrolase [Rhodococcus phenolicus]